MLHVNLPSTWSVDNRHYHLDTRLWSLDHFSLIGDIFIVRKRCKAKLLQWSLKWSCVSSCVTVCVRACIFIRPPPTRRDTETQRDQEILKF